MPFFNSLSDRSGFVAVVTAVQHLRTNKHLMLGRQIALIDFNYSAGTLIALLSAVESWGFVMSSSKQEAGRVKLDPSKLLGFSQLTKVDGAQGAADSLFNKRGVEPSSPQAQADSLFNKRGSEPTSPSTIDAFFNKRGTEGSIIQRGK